LSWTFENSQYNSHQSELLWIDVSSTHIISTSTNQRRVKIWDVVYASLLAYAFCFRRLEMIHLVEETLSEIDDYRNFEIDHDDEWIVEKIIEKKSGHESIVVKKTKKRVVDRDERQKKKINELFDDVKQKQSRRCQ
jgi:hypothetical protein